MDVSKLLTAGEWLDVPSVEGYEEFGPFRLKITPLDPLEYIEIMGQLKMARETLKPEELAPFMEKFIPKILGLVVDWNFEESGNKIDCSEANKTKYLRRLLARRMKNDQGKYDDSGYLLFRIANFAFLPDEQSKN